MTINAKKRTCARCGTDLSARAVEVYNKMLGKNALAKRRPPTISLTLTLSGVGPETQIHREWCPTCAEHILVHEHALAPLGEFWSQVGTKLMRAGVASSEDEES
jgi:ribosomal protein S27AE